MGHHAGSGRLRVVSFSTAAAATATAAASLLQQQHALFRIEDDVGGYGGYASGGSSSHFPSGYPSQLQQQQQQQQGSAASSSSANSRPTRLPAFRKRSKADTMATRSCLSNSSRVSRRLNNSLPSRRSSSNRPPLPIEASTATTSHPTRTARIVIAPPVTLPSRQRWLRESECQTPAVPESRALTTATLQEVVNRIGATTKLLQV